MKDKGLKAFTFTLLHINFVLIKLIECINIWLGQFGAQLFGASVDQLLVDQLPVDLQTYSMQIPMEFGGLDSAPVFLTKQFSQLTLIFLTILKQSDRIGDNFSAYADFLEAV